MAFIEQDRRSRLPSLVAVAAVHVGIGYAFLSGLAYDVLTHGPDIFRLIEVTDAPPPPPPERQRAVPTQSRPAAARTLAVPDTIVSTPAEPIVVDIPPMPLPSAGMDDGRTIAASQTEPERPVVQPTAPRARGDRTRWIGTEDYPPSALRQGDEVSVGIAAQVGRDGRVSTCAVTASSGHRLLDEATCRLYSSRARFAPAMEGGQPVIATVRDRITWRLPR